LRGSIVFVSTLNRLFGYLRPYLGRLMLATVLLAKSGALMGAVISGVKPLVNDVLMPGGSATESSGGSGDILRWFQARIANSELFARAREQAFVALPLLFVGIYFLRSVFGYLGEYYTLRAGASMIRDLRLDLYESITYQSLHFFQLHPTGVIQARIVNDIQQIQKMATGALANGVRVGTMVPFLILVALYHEWRMTLFAMLGLPLLAFPVIKLSRKLRRAYISSQEHMGDVAHKINESVGGVRVVQGFGMERYEIDRFSESLESMLRAELRAGRTISLLPAMTELAGAGLGAVLFWVAGMNIARGNLDAGDFAVVLFCLGLLFVSIRRLNSVYGELQRALAAGSRVFDMLDREPEIRDLPGATSLAPFERAISFEQVEFSYGDENVLSGVDLILRAGEVVALVGPSGSGKSTLASLLPRFYDPTAGRILFDGRDIREATLESLRSQIGIVTQETIVFDDTVRNNIAYGRRDTTREQIESVARAAHAHEFIERLPQGYDTVLGERGLRLSMGQRQRVTIARALFKDPPLLILDEATSALDAESEALVQQALEVLMRGRTSLVIAHRLATVRRANRILVLDDGRIIEHGSHDELIVAGGMYARLCELQFQQHDVGSSA
jgi:subfamily B ATP-binding cassette protein MsbA